MDLYSVESNKLKKNLIVVLKYDLYVCFTVNNCIITSTTTNAIISEYMNLHLSISKMCACLNYKILDSNCKLKRTLIFILNFLNHKVVVDFLSLVSVIVHFTSHTSALVGSLVF